jgi:hypothetical protein
MPRPAKSLTSKRGKIRPFADGRAQLFLGDQPAGIYASEAAAEAGLETFKRMGVAS